MQLPQLLDFDGIGTVANAFKHPWLGYTHSPESNKAMGYTVKYWIHQNQGMDFGGLK